MRSRSLRRARLKAEATARDWVPAGADWVQIRIGVTKQHTRRYAPCQWSVALGEKQSDLAQVLRGRPSSLGCLLLPE